MESIIIDMAIGVEATDCWKALFDWFWLLDVGRRIGMIASFVQTWCLRKNLRMIDPWFPTNQSCLRSLVASRERQND